MNAARRTAAVASLLLLLAAQATQAQTIWQNGTNDSNWQTGGNWSAGTPAAGSTAQFDDTGANSATPVSLGAATTGTLNFINNSNNYTLGAAGGTDTLAFSGGGNSLTQSGTGNNTINAQISGSGLTGTVSAGTLTLGNAANSIDSASTFTIMGGSLVSNTIGATTGIGNAAVQLNGGNLTFSAPQTITPGLFGQYWQGQNPPQVPFAGAQNSTFATNISGLHSYLSAIGPATNSGQLSETGNGVQGWNGGVNFSNSGFGTGNALLPLGLNYGTNNIVTDWTGEINVLHAGSYTFQTQSDDGSLVFVDGQLVVNNNGPHGAGGVVTDTITLSAGLHTIEIPYTEGGGGWGVTASFTGPTAGTQFLGIDNADATFETVSTPSVNPTNSINVQGASSLTVNSSSNSTVGTVTLADGSNLTVNGSSPMVTFANTIANGNSTITNSGAVELGQVTTTGGFVSLTAAGSGTLFLDNTTGGGNPAFASGTINATGTGQVVGVNVGGVNSLGNATLNVNGGNFSLGSDSNATFGNAITVNNNGSITAQTFGAGATDGHTINLNGGITLTNGTLTLNAANNYSFAIGNSISGGGTLTANTNVTLNASSPSFSGTYNVNAGTTTASAAGGNEFGSAFVNVNNGSTLTMNTAGDTLGGGANINNGTLNLNAANININNTTIGGSGTLNLGASGGTGNVSLNNGSIIQAQGGAQSFAGNLTLTGGSANFGNSGQNLNFTGAVSGAGGLTQNGSGTTTLSGPLSYQGPTNVNVGTLALQSNLTGGGPVNVNAFFGVANVNVGPGGSLGSSPLTVNPNGAVTVTGSTLGSGSATVQGSVQFNPGASNTASYTGATMNFNGGTISASSGTANLSGTNLVASPFTPAVVTANNALTALGYNQGSTVWTNSNPATGGFAAMNSILTGNNGANPADWSTQLSAAHNFTTTAPINAGSGINQPNGNNADLPFYNFFTGNTSLTSTTPNSGDFNFTAGFFGTFTAPVTGLYHFQVGQGDDNAGVIVDTTGSGHFNAGDQFAGATCCGGTVGFNTYLTAGQSALVGFVDQDTGGGSGLVAQFSLPGGPLQVVDPSQAGQAGLWQIQSQMQSGGATANVSANASLAVNSFTGFTNVNLTNGSALTLSNQTVSTATSSNTTNMSVTGTSATAALNLGTFTTVHVQNLSVADGNTLNVSGVGGVLKVDGVGGPGAGMVAVTGGATYGGAGSIAGTLSIGSGGILAPGDAANTTVGGLTLGDNSTMTYNLNIANVEHMAYSPANGNDLTTVTNSNGLAVSSNAYLFGVDGTTVNVIPGANFGRGTYELLAYTGTFTGSLSSFGIGTAPSQFGYQFVNLITPGGGQIDLRVTPEPSAVALLVLGLAGLALGCRRRLAKRAA